MTDTNNNEFTLTCRFNSFDKIVEVIFMDTIDAISDCQKNNFDQFISRQDSLVPGLMQQIFSYYKESYPSYYEGWSYGNQLTKEQIEENLPSPTNAESLMAFIEPLTIYIADKQKCEDGTLGIYFDCTWDIKNSLGVLIKDWQVAQVSTGDIAFLFSN